MGPTDADTELGTAYVPLTEDSRPRLRDDLEVSARGNGRVTVKRPLDGSQFEVYDIEWELALLMDGSRTINELAKTQACRAHGGNAKQLATFARELRSYGFLANDAEDSDPTESESSEVRHLLDTAVAMQSRGNTGAAINYLQAALEIDPQHRRAQELLQSVTESAAEGNSPEDARRQTNPHTETIIVREPAPAPPRSSPLKWITLVLVTSVSASVVSVVLLRQNGDQPSTNGPSAPPETPANPSPPTVLVAGTEVVLRPRQRANLVAPMTGVVSHLSPKAEVKQGDVVVKIVTKKELAKKRRLQSTANRLRKLARGDPAYQRFAKQASAQLEHFNRTAGQGVIAPISGSVVKSGLRPGMPITRGSELLKIVNLRELVGDLPASLRNAKALRCTAPSAKSEVPCKLERIDGTTSLVIEGIPGRIEPGQTIQVERVDG